MRLFLAASIIAVAAACASPLEEGIAAYRHGDFDAAARLWEPLARQGDPHAQYNMGHLSQHGLGRTPRDEAAALHWYGFAAQQGHRDAMLAIANLELHAGRRDSAARWLEHALRWTETSGAPADGGGAAPGVSDEDLAALGITPGCVEAGTCVPPERLPYSPAPLSDNRVCTADAGCGVDEFCAISYGASAGLCRARGVDVPLSRLGSPAPGATARACTSDLDCASGQCDRAARRCVGIDLPLLRRDSREPGALRRQCVSDSDCFAGRCDRLNRLCVGS